MKKIRLSVPFIFLFVAIVCATSCKEDEIITPPVTVDETVSGFLMLDENTPVSSAKLEITDMDGNLLHTGVTKEDGYFAIEKEDMPPNTNDYVVTLSKNEKAIRQIKLNTLVDNSVSNSGKGNVLLNDDYEYDFIWTVKIIDKVTKKPLENIIYKLWTVRDGSGTVYEFTSNAEGLVELQLINGYFYQTATIQQEGYLNWNSPHGIWRSASVIDHNMYTIELEPKFTPDNTTNNRITVQLERERLGELGNPSPWGVGPLCNKKVIIKGDNGFIDSGYTGALDDLVNTARVTFTGLKSGIYTIRHEAVVNEYDKSEIQVQVAGNSEQYFVMTHYENRSRCKNNVLIVKLKDENGNPITAGTAKAEAICVTNEWSGISTITEDGSAVFTDVHQSEDQFLVWAECATKIYKKTATKPIIFRCNDTIIVEQTLAVDRECIETDCNLSVDVFVYNVSASLANPPKIKNATVVITGPNGFTHTGVTDSKNADMLTLNNLCPGAYELSLVSDEFKAAPKRFTVSCFSTHSLVSLEAYNK